MSVFTVGQIVHTLPEGEPVWGVTSLAGEIFLLKGRDQIEVYDVINYSLLRRLAVPNSRSPTDMTSCARDLCTYICDRTGECVHRLDVQASAFTRWSVEDRPDRLSMNASHNVLVTCDTVCKIKEFSSLGDLLRELTLPANVINPCHAIQTRQNEFVICHGGWGVCKISADGRYQQGSGHGQYDVPAHLAVDNYEFVFVADVNNRRVKLLSLTLGHVRDVASRDQLKWRPWRLCLDVQRRRLYVADNEWKEGSWTSGRVVVFSV